MAEIRPYPGFYGKPVFYSETVISGRYVDRPVSEQMVTYLGALPRFEPKACGEINGKMLRMIRAGSTQKNKKGGAGYHGEVVVHSADRAIDADQLVRGSKDDPPEQDF